MEYIITYYPEQKVARLHLGRNHHVEDTIYNVSSERIILQRFFEHLNEGFTWEFLDTDGKIIKRIYP